MKKSHVIIITLIFLGLPYYLYAENIPPDTGQTKCYDNSTEIVCPQTGEPFFGQDGNYLINEPSFTKLDQFGNPLPDSAADWAMVRHNNTELIWEVKTDDFSVHDKDNLYTWQQANDVFIAYLNNNAFGGFTDWRIPNVKELLYLVNREDNLPAINQLYFPNTKISPAHYWTSTNFAADTNKPCSCIKK